MSYNIFQER